MGLGEAGEGKNVTHQQKKLNEEELKEFRSRFGNSLNDQDCIEVPFYRPAEDSVEIQYLRARREALGGYTPTRAVRSKPITTDNEELFKEFYDGSEGREVSTTMAFVGMLRKVLKDPEIGKLVVPIVPDEARTFVWNRSSARWNLFERRTEVRAGGREHAALLQGSEDGQFWKRELPKRDRWRRLSRRDGVFDQRNQYDSVFHLLLDVRIPAYRDFVWVRGHEDARIMLGERADARRSRARLQHQDGNSHVLALPVPNLHAYDPAYAYEIAVFVHALDAIL